MKLTNHALLGALASLAGAFPASVLEQAAQDPRLMARGSEIMQQFQERAEMVKADGATAIFEPIPLFDAEKQFVDSSDSGPNPWRAPGKNDLRGPCPGLNAFANHGFLPRNGYATITQFIRATTNVVGMGPQLAAFLAVLGASINGDGVSWSIGGTPPRGTGGLLAQQGNGISGSHNKYESDASPCRPDLYQEGNTFELQDNQFNQLISLSPGGFVDLDRLTRFRSARFDRQVETNPFFFNGPFTGVLVQPAAYTFIFRFMANHSEADKTGYLSHDVLASWFAMTKGPNGQYTGKQGFERIPLNWYKRSVAYPYDNEYFLADTANAIALYPKFANVGGNTGTPNSFTGVNIADLSGGVFNGGSVLQGNNFACFAYQFAAQAKPDVALAPLTQLTNALNPILGRLSCPTLERKDEEQLLQFPGYTRSNVTP